MDLRRLAKVLAVSERTVWRLVASGELPRPVRAGKCVRWFQSDIAGYQQRLREQRGE
jgi:predicted DNA-binding transcriptional regulator AlpA